jgi:hypothetical protein
MKRTNIYLAQRQADLLRRVGESQGRPVAELVREAVDAWLTASGVKEVTADEWQRRFDALLGRRRQIATEERFSEEQVERDVTEAVGAVRKRRLRSARRR